jgi:pimeloyl-ACP methyl ester carboxylesterase
VRTRDGRDLDVLVSGAGSGPVIVIQHGTPSDHPPLPAHVADAAARGARLVTYARPGYDGSSRRAGRSVADAAADVAAIVDALGVDRFVTWGISGGGPHALATAALLPERCAAMATLASVAPYDAAGLDFLAGMGEDNVVEFGLAVHDHAGLRDFLEQQRAAMLDADPAGMVEALRSILSPVDQAVFTGEIGQHLVSALREAVRPGIDGWYDDDLAFARPWGFAPEDVRVPALLWQGEQDLMVPAAHGAWLADRIPGVEAYVDPAEGHLTLLLSRVPDVHAWLLGHL